MTETAITPEIHTQLAAIAAPTQAEAQALAAAHGPQPAPVQPVTVALQPASSETAPVYLAYVAARDARGAAWEALQDAIGQQDPIGPPRAVYEAAVAAADTARTAYVQALKDEIEAGQ